MNAIPESRITPEWLAAQEALEAQGYFVCRFPLASPIPPVGTVLSTAAGGSVVVIDSATEQEWFEQVEKFGTAKIKAMFPRGSESVAYLKVVGE